MDGSKPAGPRRFAASSTDLAARSAFATVDLVAAVHRLRLASSLASTLNLMKSCSAIAVALSSSSSCHWTLSHSLVICEAYRWRSLLPSGRRSMRSSTPRTLSTVAWISSLTR